MDLKETRLKQKWIRLRKSEFFCPPFCSIAHLIEELLTLGKNYLLEIMEG